jgi:hypothetical protein
LLRIALSAGVLAQALVIPVEYWNIPERFPLAVASGGESSRHFLERVLPPYRALEWLNGAVKPGEKVAAFGVEGIRYYCRVPMGCANDTKDLGRIVTLTDPEEIGRRLDAGGYGWLIRRAGPDAGLPALDAFLRVRGRLRHDAGGFRVFRLDGGPPDSSGSPVERRP